MCINRLVKIKFIALLFFAFSFSQAFAMTLLKNSVKTLYEYCKHKKPVSQEESKTVSVIPIVHDPKELYQLLYQHLETLPPELIKIIIAYDAHQIQGRLVRTIKGSDDCMVQCITELSDKRLVTGYEDGTIQIWNQDGNLLNKIQSHINDIRCLIQLSENCLVAAGSTPPSNPPEWPQSCLEFWNTDGTKIIAKKTLKTGFNGIPKFLVEYSKGKLITCSPRYIAKWDLETEKKEGFIDKSDQYINNIIKLTNGLLLVATPPVGLEWWDINKTRLVKSLTWEKISHALSELSDGRIAISNGGKIGILNPINNRIQFIGEHKDTVYSIATLSNGLIATAGRDHTIKFWNPNTGERTGEIKQSHTGEVDRLLLLSNGHLASTGNGPIDGYTNAISIWR
jgi:WD40 repeat protein